MVSEVASHILGEDLDNPVEKREVVIARKILSLCQSLEDNPASKDIKRYATELLRINQEPDNDNLSD